MKDDLKITLVPSQKLRTKSRTVESDELGAELDAYMDNMLVKMYQLNGVGLAGIQVGDDRRLLVADAGSGPAKMVNPEILELSEEKVTYTEGCLSIPGLRVPVERSEHIKLRYLTPHGEIIEGVLSGLHSVVIQHEIDHLDGKTLLDKVSGLKRSMYLKKLKKKKKLQKKMLKELKRYGY
tara:strand:+ start:45 stop:584 length:540 start_codon:yes stop_codon:yes gene_type:complete